MHSAECKRSARQSADNQFVCPVNNYPYGWGEFLARIRPICPAFEHLIEYGRHCSRARACAPTFTARAPFEHPDCSLVHEDTLIRSRHTLSPRRRG